jgi:hypothetical protein
MTFKHTTTTFLSKFGKHNIHSFGKDMGFDEFIKHSTKLKDGKMTTETFSNLSQGMVNTDTLINLGIRAGN